MLKLIIEASSNEGDLVLDCFAGSGTTLIAAQMLKRKWIGVDQSAHSIDISRERLNRRDGFDGPCGYAVLSQNGVTGPARRDHAREPKGFEAHRELSHGSNISRVIAGQSGPDAT
jgi:hypothetical protein